MPTLQQHLDDLDRMVDSGASVAKTRSQIAFIGREIAALEADYSRLAEAHANLQQAHTDLQAKICALEAQPEKKPPEHSVDDAARCILDTLFQNGEAMTDEEIAEIVGYAKSIAHYHIEQLKVTGFLERIRFTGDQRRIDGPDWGYRITQKGRQWILDHAA